MLYVVLFAFLVPIFLKDIDEVKKAKKLYLALFAFSLIVVTLFYYKNGSLDGIVSFFNNLIK
jgi:hypothetical protein